MCRVGERAAATHPIGRGYSTAGTGSNQGYCRDRVTAGPGSNLSYRAGLLPGPAVTSPIGQGGVTAGTGSNLGYCRARVTAGPVNDTVTART